MGHRVWRVRRGLRGLLHRLQGEGLPLHVRRGSQLGRAHRLSVGARLGHEARKTAPPIIFRQKIGQCAAVYLLLQASLFNSPSCVAKYEKSACEVRFGFTPLFLNLEVLNMLSQSAR